MYKYSHSSTQCFRICLWIHRSCLRFTKLARFTVDRGCHRFIRPLTTCVFNCCGMDSPDRKLFPKLSCIYIYIFIDKCDDVYIYKPLYTYSTLHCVALHYIALHIALHYIALHCITLHYIALDTCMHAYIHTLHYVTLRYITIHYNTLQYIAIHYITLQYITIHCNTLQYITIHYNTLQYITIHYNTLQYITIHTYIHIM